MSKEDDKSGLKTAPLDARFANANVTKYCYVMFIDYLKCTRLLGKGDKGCDYFKKTYTTICPNFWIEKWTQQIEDGVFPHDLPEEKK